MVIVDVDAIYCLLAMRELTKSCFCVARESFFRKPFGCRFEACFRFRVYFLWFPAQHIRMSCHLCLPHCPTLALFPLPPVHRLLPSLGFELTLPVLSACRSLCGPDSVKRSACVSGWLRVIRFGGPCMCPSPRRPRMDSMGGKARASVFNGLCSGSDDISNTLAVVWVFAWVENQ